MSSEYDRLRKLEAAIEAQEALRSAYGDAIVDAAIEALRQQIAALPAEPANRPRDARDDFGYEVDEWIASGDLDKRYARALRGWAEFHPRPFDPVVAIVSSVPAVLTPAELAENVEARTEFGR